METQDNGEIESRRARVERDLHSCMALSLSTWPSLPIAFWNRWTMLTLRRPAPAVTKPSFPRHVYSREPQNPTRKYKLVRAQRAINEAVRASTCVGVAVGRRRDAVGRLEGRLAIHLYQGRKFDGICTGSREFVLSTWSVCMGHHKCFSA